jgi:putative chitinase
MQADKHFFDTVRPLFGGRLNEYQVDGMNKIVEYADKWGYSPIHTAYILATAKHETANWMQPIREGARRYGPEYTDAAAKRAVASIHAKGIIRTNYALPSGPHRQSYYGRGLVQITWYDNYLKFERLLKKPFTAQPDLVLEWDIALDVLFLGMRDGMFRRGPRLSLIETVADYKAARGIVNGDSSKTWGGLDRIDDRLAGYARTFLTGLEGE